MRHKIKFIAILSAITLLTFGVICLNSNVLAADKITIGWTPPDITGVFKTATDYFEKAAQDAKAHGIQPHRR